MKNSLFHKIVFSLVLVLFLAGCTETRYYHKNNKHSERYEKRHNHMHSRGIAVEIHK